MEFRIPISKETLASVSKLDEFRGRWAVDPGVPAERLARMREATRIQSAASSSRLGGIRVSDAEVAGLLRNDAVPLRDAPEILGYAAATDEELTAGRLLESSELRRLNALML